MISTFPKVVEGGWLSYDQVPDAIRRRHTVKVMRMSSRFQIICDGCEAVANDTLNWAAVEIPIKPKKIDGETVDSEHLDFCPACWKAMRVISRERTSKQA